jgi:hypothetical protein
MLGIRPDYLIAHAVMTIGVAGLGLFVRLTHSTTPRSRFVGWVTYTLSVAAFASAGFVALLLGWPAGKEWLGMTFAGGGFGFVCGMTGGRFVWKYYRKEIEGGGEPGA